MSKKITRVIPPLTGFGLAERFLSQYIGEIFYVVDLKCWLYWTGKQFIIAVVIVEALAKQVIFDLRKELIKKKPLKNEDKFGNPIFDDDILEFLEMNSNFSGINRTLLNARSMPEIVAYDAEFDNHPNLLNVQNGIIDLKIGELIAHSPEWKMRKIARVKFVRGAKSEKFNTFLNDIAKGDKDLKEYLQRIFGYALTGSTKEQVFFIFVGNGANGKSTILNLFLNILGDYAKATPTQTLMSKGYQGINTDEARLNGARFVVASEVNKKQKLDEAKIKKMTGGDTITARFMRKDFVEFQAEFKIFMAVNTLPEVSADDAIFRRIRVVPFNARFEADKLNKDLQDELFKEREAFLDWAAEGAAKWYKEGFSDCQKVEDATKIYKKTADILQRFLAQTVSFDPAYKISIAELYDAYVAWAAENSEIDLAKRDFGDLMRVKNYAQSKSGSTRSWNGLDFKTRVK